ncbi:MAG: TlpA family protein disulfide reductase [Polymorphobacter sp.]
MSPSPQGDTAKPAASQGGVAAAVKVDRSHAGTPAPTLTFEARGGDIKRIADFGGKPVLVNLWATWCAPCVAELPELNTLAVAKADSLTVLAISQDMEGWQAVNKRFTPDTFSKLTPYLDQPSNFAVAIGAKGLPVSILYGADGREIWRVARPLEWNSPAVRALLP